MDPINVLGKTLTEDIVETDWSYDVSTATRKLLPREDR
jgi:hypothetical protein